MLLQLFHSRLACVLLLGVACGLALPQAAKADIGLCSSVPNNLILNCGFETGDFSDWTQGGNLAFTSVTGALTVGGSGGTTFNPNSGNFQAELGPTNSDGTLSQTFLTKTGDVYLVQFYMAGEGGAGSDFSAFINAATLLATNPAPNQSYTLYTYTITAGGPSTTLQFNFRSDSGFQLLDDVSVNDTTGVTPEPASYTLLGGGLAGLFAISRRRRMRA